jgi:hypothetical protein
MLSFNTTAIGLSRFLLSQDFGWRGGETAAFSTNTIRMCFMHTDHAEFAPIVALLRQEHAYLYCSVFQVGCPYSLEIGVACCAFNADQHVYYMKALWLAH